MVQMAESSQHQQNGESAVTRESILEIIRRRDGIEQQIKSLGDILRSNNVGMTEPLTDPEGFPRNDIDVYQVRHARHEIICLQNDYKTITKEIESKLEIFYQTHQQSSNSVEDMRMDVGDGLMNAVQGVPIVKVNLVSEGSPAFHAGVLVGDEIVSFGSINVDNFTNVQDIGNLVQRSQGRVLTVLLNRNGTSVQLALIPGPWSGRGLLGCNIIPIQNVDR